MSSSWPGMRRITSGTGQTWWGKACPSWPRPGGACPRPSSWTSWVRTASPCPGPSGRPCFWPRSRPSWTGPGSSPLATTMSARQCRTGIWPEEAERRAAHLRLADYFEAQALEMDESPNLRKIDELPWQLARAGAWERLQGLLVEPAFFRQAWKHDQFEVKAGWAQIEAHSPLRLAAAYRGVLADPARQEAELCLEVASAPGRHRASRRGPGPAGPPGGALSPGRGPGQSLRLPGQPGDDPCCPGRPGRGHGPPSRRRAPLPGAGEQRRPLKNPGQPGG